MNKRIIIQSAFNVMKFDIENELNEEWIKYRLKIFTNYTLKSLKAQTNQWFTFLLRCRDKTIPLIKKEIGELLPENVLIVGVNEFHEKIKELIKDYNYLYLVREDSDDMYVKTFIDNLHNYPTKSGTEILINQNCYIYHIYQKRLASYFYKSPPAYTQIFKTIEYLRGKRYHLKGGHTGAILLKHEFINGVNYLVTIHQENCLGEFGASKYKKEWSEIEDKNDIKEILEDFGISQEENKV